MPAVPYIVSAALKEVGSANTGSDVHGVDVSPDGTKVVSGLRSGMIKVWDVANPRPYNASEWESVEGVFPGTPSWEAQTPIAYWKNTITGDVRRENSSAGALSPRTDQSLGFGCVLGPKSLLLLQNGRLLPRNAATLELKSEKANAHDCPVLSIDFSPDGSKIVSASGDFYGDGGSNTIKVWDSGALWPQIASPWPNLTIRDFSGRYTRAEERKGERPRSPDQFRRVLARWNEHRVCLWRSPPRHDQSLGFGCDFGPKSPLLGQI